MSSAGDRLTFYFWDSDRHSIMELIVRDTDAEHVRRGKCSGIPACCIAEYLRQRAGERAGKITHRPFPDGWGYIPCDRCWAEDRRVKVRSCTRKRCTCGQWKRATRVPDGYETRAAEALACAQDLWLHTPIGAARCLQIACAAHGVRRGGRAHRILIRARWTAMTAALPGFTFLEAAGIILAGDDHKEGSDERSR